MTAFLVLILRKGENGQGILTTCQYHNFKLQIQGGNNPIKTHTFSELGLKLWNGIIISKRQKGLETNLTNSSVATLNINVRFLLFLPPPEINIHST